MLAEKGLEREVLTKKRALAEYAISEEELLTIPIARHNCNHGNYYPVWHGKDLIAYQAQRKKAVEDKLVVEHGGADNLKRKRDEDANEKKDQLYSAESLASMTTKMIQVSKATASELEVLFISFRLL